MAKMSYADQLKHPNWQRKRLGILNRADFSCESCGDKETTLHVHHKRYVKGRNAWDYEDSELVALCATCHEKGHSIRERLDRMLAGTVFEDIPAEQYVFCFLAGALIPLGVVGDGDAEAAIEQHFWAFGIGYLVAALGPADIIAAVNRKIDEGRLERSDFLDAVMRGQGPE